MDLAANELSIYDKLSETVDLVRQTGHQCGMSEKAIEKFIRQLLEKNEPQRGPPQYPLLLAMYKVFITLGLILLTAYFVVQPFSPLAPEPVLSGAYTWRSLIHHIRLMSLPITKKYMPENKGVPLRGGKEDRAFPDFDPWWTNECEQNESDPTPANCTGCAQKLPLQVMLLEDTPRRFERLHPLVIKTGQSLSTEGLQDFLCQYPEVTEGFTEGFFTKWWRCFPGRWFPFPYPWRRPLNRSHILHELFPVFTYLPFPKEASLKKCFLLQPEPIVGSKMHRMHDLFTIGSGEAMLQLLPPFQCRSHCQSVAMPLEPGDIDKEIETRRGEVTIPRPNRQLGKASVLSDSFYTDKPEEVRFRFDETLSVPSLLVKQFRQYVRARVTQGNSTFLVDPTVWSQPHSHDPPLAP